MSFCDESLVIPSFSNDDDDTSPLLSNSTLLDDPPSIEFDLFDNTNTDEFDFSESTGWTENLLLRRNIFRHKSIPMVGRQKQRKHAWETFEAMAEDQRPRAIVLSGDHGLGKTKFAEWLVERIRERGLGWDVTVSADRGVQGVLEGFSKFLRIDGLMPSEARTRLRELVLALTFSKDVASHESKLFASTFAVSENDDATMVFVPIEKKIDVIKRAVRRLAWRLPIVLVLHNFDGDEDLRLLIKQLLRDPDPLPICMVILESPGSETVTDEMLKWSRRVQRLEFSPLDAESQRELASLIVGSDPNLIDVAVDQSDGNPVVILQTVEDWFDRGLLEVVDGGIEVNDTQALALPHTIDAIWESRLALVANECDAEVELLRNALEIAATLGRKVTDQTWRTACDRIDVTVKNGWLDALVRHEVLVATLDGWEFVQASIQDQILELARIDGRLEGRHRICAETLVELFVQLPPAKRIRNHYDHANDLSSALPHLWKAFCVEHNFGRFRKVEQLKKEIEEIIVRERLPAGHIAQVWRVLGEQMLSTEDVDLREAENVCREMGYVTELALLLRTFGDRARAAGDLDRCLASYEEALVQLQDSEERELVVSTMVSASEVLTQLGRIGAALDSLDNARALGDRLAQSTHATVVRRVAVNCALLGDFDRAESLFRDALTLAIAAQNRRVEATVLIDIGDLYRWRVDVTQCEQYYNKARPFIEQAEPEMFKMFSLKCAMGRLLEGSPTVALTLVERIPVGATDSRELGIVKALTKMACRIESHDDSADLIGEISSVQKLLSSFPICSLDILWLMNRLRKLVAGTDIEEYISALSELVPLPQSS